MTDPVAEVRAEIAQTREALAETTAALAAKADVKTRATVTIQEHKTQLTVAAGVSALLLVLVIWRRHK